MKKLSVDMSKLSDENMSLIIDILCEEFGDEFREMTKVPHALELSAEPIGFNQKNEDIKYINKIIAEFGSFTTAEVEADCSPCIAVIGESAELVEAFYESKGTVVSYHGSTECGLTHVPYEEMSDDVVSHIVRLAEDFEAISLQDEKRIS